VDLRDRYGITQLTLDGARVSAESMERAKRLRSEWVVAAGGTVRRRPEATRNAHIATGEIEIEVDALDVLNPSEVPPFGLDEHDAASEDLRLEYRFVDLRRHDLQAVLELRHRVCQTVRRFLDSQSFLEIETPMLVRPTPEGARDYLVPSRIRPGSFYALPQSPQIYKQILMVSGFDRYFQLARCMRDEDLRADRQPEFTQIDIEMSFVSEESVYAVVEGMMAAIYRETKGIEIALPLPRLTFHDAMNRFGSDKPDLRFGHELEDVTAAVRATEFRAFAGVVDAGGVVKALVVPASYAASRKVVDDLETVAKLYGAQGLARARAAGGGLDGGIAKFLSDTERRAIVEATSAGEGDTVLFVADRWSTACTALGAVRLEMGRRYCPPDPNVVNLLWVNDFNLFEADPHSGAPVPAHHVFTMPKPEDLPLLDTEPLKVRAQLYDLVLNGVELGSGSIRVHRRALQEKIFHIIGVDAGEAERRFGFMLRAFQYGAPPHGGIALGLDRITMILAGKTSLRDTVAFPKTSSAASLMDGSPAPVDPADLRALRLSIHGAEGPGA
jgi:aspartyl-tRNA synthetase